MDKDTLQQEHSSSRYSYTKNVSCRSSLQGIKAKMRFLGKPFLAVCEC